MAVEAGPIKPRASGWWIAGWMTPWCWAISTVMQMATKGQTFPRAACIGLASALGGLTLWGVYHAVSRRYDGLACFILGMIVVSGGADRLAGALHVEVGRGVAVLVVGTLPWIFLVGLWARNLPKDVTQPAKSPLWDSEVDPPAPQR